MKALLAAPDLVESLLPALRVGARAIAANRERQS